tara:strand:- start:632 stop:850 length:219 start_codon:yes stop_codon:yes gene_type:complete
MMMIRYFEVGDRVQSRGGWLGTVIKLREHKNSRTMLYLVRWDRNGRESWERTSIQRADALLPDLPALAEVQS